MQQSAVLSDHEAKTETSLRMQRCQRRIPNLYMVIANISKRNNIRALLNTAAAFGCCTIFVVGQKNFDTSLDESNRDLPNTLRTSLLDKHVVIERFEKWRDCASTLRERGINLIGVEIHPDAVLLEDYIAKVASDSYGYSQIAFCMGNEGQGLSENQMKDCDEFIRIPQFGGGTASLNVYVAASIILQRFHSLLRQLEAENDKVSKEECNTSR